MPSVSKAQQRFMGLVHAYKKGEVPASKVSQAVKDAAKSMKKKSTKDFASTKHDDLPNKVREYLMSENPAASAAAAMAMMQLQNPDTGKKVSAITPLRNKDHKLHKKSKGIFQRLKDKFMKKNESINEDGHTDVASAERKLKLIMQDAMDTLNALRGLSNEDSLPSWWTDKITLAKDYVAKSRDYIMNPAESVNEGKKRYYQQDRVGSAKYTISYHDGKKKHKDGSDFFDIKIFRNKKDLAKFVNTLSKSGYVYGFNESVNEKVIKVSKKDDIPGNPMKMKGEEKIKKLTYSGSVGMDKPGSYEIKGNKLNVNNIRPRDKGFFVRHFTMGTGFRKANLYYDGVHWQGGKKF